jgi:SAM-dependent methyltransferase
MLMELASCGWEIEHHARLENSVWIPKRSVNDQISFPDDFREKLALLEGRSLWFQSRNRLIHSVITHQTDLSNLIDVGAGNGAVASYLARHGIETLAIEPGHPGAAYASSQGIDVVVAGRLEDLDLPSNSVNGIGLFDVIEHLEEPESLLNQAFDVIRSGGWCLITVPAFHFLWSQADEHAGHFRRYSRKTLDQSLTRCGFEPRFSSYCFAGAVPLLFLLRTIPFRLGRRMSTAELEQSLDRELGPQGRILERCGRRANQLEIWWLQKAHLPFGTSIIAAYQKP